MTSYIEMMQKTPRESRRDTPIEKRLAEILEDYKLTNPIENLTSKQALRLNAIMQNIEDYLERL